VWMIRKTTVAIGSAIREVDTIEHEGEFWLVPDWFESPDGKYLRPMRIISLSTIPHQETSQGFLISSPLPKGVLLGHPPEGEEDRYLIHENPEIIVPNPDVLN